MNPLHQATITSINATDMDPDHDDAWPEDMNPSTSARLRDSDELIGIAEMCDAFQVSPRTLRFYEERACSRHAASTAPASTHDKTAPDSLAFCVPKHWAPPSEIKNYLDMYGQHGEGRIQQLIYAIDKTDAAIKELEAKRAQIDASLAEMRLINETSRKALAKKRGENTEH